MALRILFVAVGFAAGSIPFGLLFTRWLIGADVRAAGSGNIGATNVTRVAGKKIGAAVLACDVLKGALPVIASRVVLPAETATHAEVALAAALGHVFSPWLRFKGGKGVATAFGGMAVLVPWAALVGAVIYALLVARLRVSSVGSLAGAAASACIAQLLEPPAAYRLYALAVLLLILVTHRGNIRRLMRRSERRV